MKPRLYSDSWYRVRALRPRLERGVRVHRQHARGRLWYVLETTTSQGSYRFAPSAYAVLSRMDGKRTVESVWELACRELGDGAPSQDQLIQFLGQLHGAGAVQYDVPPDAAELCERHARRSRSRVHSKLANPLFCRVPLLDPDPLLNRLFPLVKPAFSRAALCIWVTVVASAAVLASMHWNALSHNFIDRVLAPGTLLRLCILIPLIKLVHELAHGCALKAFGGRVREAGLFFLVFAPLPYVDASAASAFPAKRARLLVSAAGMMAELFLASLALFLWVAIEPGWTRAVLYEVVVAAGVWTLVFNANPLFKFDGYYILADLLEIPNLQSDSYGYLRSLVERYLLGNPNAAYPARTPGEHGWLLSYAVASLVYRVAVLTAIVLLVAGKFFFLGVLLALAALLVGIVVPLVKGLHYLLKSPELEPVRSRALGATAFLACVAFLGFCVLPVPLRTSAEAIIGVTEEGIVRAETEGFLVQLVVEPNTQVKRGEILAVLEDPLRPARVEALEAELASRRARRNQALIENPAEAELIREDMRHLTERLVSERAAIDRLNLQSGADGVFVVPEPDGLDGRFFQKGEVLGYVLQRNTLTARAVLRQEQVDLVERETQRVHLRFAHRIGAVLPTRIVRVVPAASTRLPSSALGTDGGGQVAVDPREADGRTSIEKLFELDLAVPASAGEPRPGSRVFVRFEHGWEPLATRFYLGLRRLFLERFHV